MRQQSVSLEPSRHRAARGGVDEGGRVHARGGGGLRRRGAKPRPRTLARMWRPPHAGVASDPPGRSRAERPGLDRLLDVVPLWHWPRRHLRRRRLGAGRPAGRGLAHAHGYHPRGRSARLPSLLPRLLALGARSPTRPRPPHCLMCCRGNPCRWQATRVGGDRAGPRAGRPDDRP
jgi:hypothetical protein